MDRYSVTKVLNGVLLDVTGQILVRELASLVVAVGTAKTRKRGMNSTEYKVVLRQW